MSELIAAKQDGKPNLILDVDGVLLVLAAERPDGYRSVPSKERYVYYNPEHGRWLMELLETRMDGFYLSSHGSDSHDDIGRLLGLPELDWINYWQFRQNGSRR